MAKRTYTEMKGTIFSTIEEIKSAIQGLTTTEALDKIIGHMYKNHLQNSLYDKMRKAFFMMKEEKKTTGNNEQEMKRMVYKYFLWRRCLLTNLETDQAEFNISITCKKEYMKMRWKYAEDMKKHLHHIFPTIIQKKIFDYAYPQEPTTTDPKIRLQRKLAASIIATAKIACTLTSPSSSGRIQSISPAIRKAFKDPWHCSSS